MSVAEVEDAAAELERAAQVIYAELGDQNLRVTVAGAGSGCIQRADALRAFAASLVEAHGRLLQDNSGILPGVRNTVRPVRRIPINDRDSSGQPKDTGLDERARRAFKKYTQHQVTSSDEDLATSNDLVARVTVRLCLPLLQVRCFVLLIRSSLNIVE